MTEPKKKAARKTPAREASTAAEAPPQPGDPDYDWSQQYPGEDFIVFTSSTGKTVGLAALGPSRKFKPGELRRARKLNEVEQTFYVIERVASPAALEVSDEFEDVDYAKMFEAWSNWAQTSAGKS